MTGWRDLNGLNTLNTKQRSPNLTNNNNNSNISTTNRWARTLFLGVFTPDKPKILKFCSAKIKSLKLDTVKNCLKS